MQIYKFSILLSFFMACSIFSSCSSSDEQELIFIGDSLIANWDVERFFPSFAIKNYGLSGSGIDHIEDYAHCFEGKEVVVIIGTNDWSYYKTNDAGKLNEYANRYVNAISNLDAATVFLFSIFPRHSESDSENINDYIRALNCCIRETIKSKTTNIIYIDAFDDMMKNGDICWELTYDGLHLNSFGYLLLKSKLNVYLK